MVPHDFLLGDNFGAAKVGISHFLSVFLEGVDTAFIMRMRTFVLKTKQQPSKNLWRDCFQGTIRLFHYPRFSVASVMFQALCWTLPWLLSSRGLESMGVGTIITGPPRNGTSRQERGTIGGEI